MLLHERRSTTFQPPDFLLSFRASDLSSLRIEGMVLLVYRCNRRYRDHRYNCHHCGHCGPCPLDGPRQVYSTQRNQSCNGNKERHNRHPETTSHELPSTTFASAGLAESRSSTGSDDAATTFTMSISLPKDTGCQYDSAILAGVITIVDSAGQKSVYCTIGSSTRTDAVVNPSKSAASSCPSHAFTHI